MQIGKKRKREMVLSINSNHRVMKWDLLISLFPSLKNLLSFHMRVEVELANMSYPSGAAPLLQKSGIRI